MGEKKIIVHYYTISCDFFFSVFLEWIAVQFIIDTTLIITSLHNQSTLKNLEESILTTLQEKNVKEKKLIRKNDVNLCNHH